MFSFASFAVQKAVGLVGIRSVRKMIRSSIQTTHRQPNLQMPPVLIVDVRFSSTRVMQQRCTDCSCSLSMFTLRVLETVIVLVDSMVQDTSLEACVLIRWLDVVQPTYRLI